MVQRCFSARELSFLRQPADVYLSPSRGLGLSEHAVKCFNGTVKDRFQDDIPASQDQGYLHRILENLGALE
jgi:hypothetical protein